MTLFYINKVAHDGLLQEQLMVAHATLPLVATGWQGPASVLITDNEGEVLTVVREPAPSSFTRADGSTMTTSSSPAAAGGGGAGGGVTALAWHPHAAVLLIGWHSGALTLWRMPDMRELGIDDGVGGGSDANTRAEAASLRAAPFAIGTASPARVGNSNSSNNNNKGLPSSTATSAAAGNTNTALLALAARAATLTNVDGAVHTHAGAVRTCTWLRRGRGVLTTSQGAKAVLWALEQTAASDAADGGGANTATTAVAAHNKNNNNNSSNSNNSTGNSHAAANVRRAPTYKLHMLWAVATPASVVDVVYTPRTRPPTVAAAPRASGAVAGTADNNGGGGAVVAAAEAAAGGDDGDDDDVSSSAAAAADTVSDDDVGFLLLDGSNTVRYLGSDQKVVTCTTQDERVTAVLYDAARHLLVTLNVSHLLDVYRVSDSLAATFVFRRKLAMPSTRTSVTTATGSDAAAQLLQQQQQQASSRVTMVWVDAGVLALACGDDRVRIFDVATEAATAVTFPQHGVHITHLACHVERGVLAVGTQEGVLAVFHSQQLQPPQQQQQGEAGAPLTATATTTAAAAMETTTTTTVLPQPLSLSAATAATSAAGAAEVWHPVATHELLESIDRIVLGPKCDLVVCTAASHLQMLHETVRQRAWDGFAAATQISSTMVVIESVTGCQCLLHSPHTIRGLSVAFPYIALWTGQQIDLYTIHDATSEYTLLTFVPTTSPAFAVHREGLFYVKDNRLVFATLQLRPIAQLAFAASEGVPALLDVMGDYLAVVSTGNYLRLAHIAPHELRPLGPSRPLHLVVTPAPSSLPSSLSPPAAAPPSSAVTIVALRVNAQGRRVAMLTSTSESSSSSSSSAAVWGGMDARVWVYDSDTDRVVSFDFASRQQVPDAVYWNTPEPNASVTGELEYLLLACETHQVRTPASLTAAATATAAIPATSTAAAAAAAAANDNAAAAAAGGAHASSPPANAQTAAAATEGGDNNNNVTAAADTVNDNGSQAAGDGAAAATTPSAAANVMPTMPDMENFADRKQQQTAAAAAGEAPRRGSLGASNLLSDHAHYLVTLFATRDGLAVHSSVTLKRYQICLAGLTIPDFLLASLKINGNPANPEDYVIEQKRLRDFDGLKSDKDVVVREALMKFSYYSTIGNMDEAYRCIKTIKNPAAWQGLARMCVSNGRLDVAAVCLATMQDGVAARALREARESYPDVVPMQLATLACSLNMMTECEQLLRSVGRYDVITDVFLACGKFEQAQRHAERYDRIRMRPVSYKYAQFMESLQNLDAAILWYHNAKCTATDVPRIFYQSNRLHELYELLKQSVNMGGVVGGSGGPAAAAAATGATGNALAASSSTTAASAPVAAGGAAAAATDEQQQQQQPASGNADGVDGRATDATQPRQQGEQGGAAAAATGDAGTSADSPQAASGGSGTGSVQALSPSHQQQQSSLATTAAAMLFPPSKELLLWWAQHCERRRNVQEALRFYHAAKDTFHVVRLLCSVQPPRIDSALDIVHAEVERARAKYQQQQAMATTAAAAATTAAPTSATDTTSTRTTTTTAAAAARGRRRSLTSSKAWMATTRKSGSRGVDGPEPVGAAYFIGRHYERMGDVERALQYYRHAGACYSAVRVACRARHDAAVREMALASEDERLMLDCAQYLERHGAFDKAVELYRCVGAVQYALHACVKGGLYDTLHELSTSLAHAAVDARVFLGMARHFQSAGNYGKAVEMLVFARHYDEALRMCQERNVRLTEDMAETMTAEENVALVARSLSSSSATATGAAMDSAAAHRNNSNSSDGGSSSSSSSGSDDARRALLCKVAAIAEEQGSWYLACKKYTQAGERMRAMRMLLRAGDTARIIFYANHARNAQMYTMAANFLQSQAWQSDAVVYKSIVLFYTKAKAYDSLANFYDACAQAYIDEQRDYAAALRTLEESVRALEKALSTGGGSGGGGSNDTRDAGSTPMSAARHGSNGNNSSSHHGSDGGSGGVRPARLTTLRQRVVLLHDMVKAQRTLAAMDATRRDTPGERAKANEVVTVCSTFIKRSRPGQPEQALVEETVRLGDVYAMLVHLYCVKLAEPRNALKVLESMAKQRIEAQYFVEMDVIEKVCTACGKSVAEVVPFTAQGGGGGGGGAAAVMAAAEQQQPPSPSAAAAAAPPRAADGNNNSNNYGGNEMDTMAVFAAAPLL